MDFLEQVTQDLVRRVGFEHLRDYTVVFPMNRASLFMRDYLRRLVKDNYGKPVVTPQFTTISGLVDSLSSLNPDDEIRSVCLLYQIYKRHTGSDLTLDVFYGWGKQLLQDFSSVDISLVDADELFQNSVYARQLDLPDLPDDVRERLEKLMGRAWNEADRQAFRREFQNLWSRLPAIYREFRAKQEAEGVGYTGARLRQVVEHWDEIDLGNRRFCFVGFNYLLKGEKRLLLKLKDRSLFYWDYDADFHTNKDAYRFIRQHIADGLTNALPEQPETARPTLHLMMAAGSNAQAQYVHSWLPDKQGKTAVVIADEGMLESVVYALPNSVSEHVNITKGYPLRNTQVYADIVAYLSDPHNDRLPAESDYTGVLTRLLETMAPVQSVLIEQDDPDDLPPKTWQELLTDESVYQARKVVSRFLALIQEGVLNDVQDMKTLRNILRRHLEMTSLPFHGEPVTDIQVMGVLETRLLDFRHLLILNVEEGVVPQHKEDRSFIPYYLRKYYGLETPDESAAAYAYNFFRLLRRADDVTLLFSEAATGMGKKTMSRFLMQLLTSDEYPIKRLRLTESATLSQSNNLSIQQSNNLITSLSSLSPSAISTYLECPMRFYYAHVLKLNVEPAPSPLLEPNELGSLVHATIRAAYSSLYPSLPAEVQEDTLATFLANDKGLNDALRTGYMALNADYFRHHSDDNCHFRLEEHPVENRVALTHTRKVLENDLLAIRRNGPFTILLMEREMSFPLTVLVNGQMQTVRVGGVIDRLDRVGNQVRVLDYKTGSYDEKKMKADSIDQLFMPGNDKRYVFQTLLYCLAVSQSEWGKENTLQPGLLFTRKGLDSFDPHIFVEGSQVTDFEAQCRLSFWSRLQDLVYEIVAATSFPQLDCKQCPDYCPFRSLCGR